MRKLEKMLEGETLPRRKRRVGRHAAMTARPPSIMDQYSMVDTVTFLGRLVSRVPFSSLEEINEQSGSILVKIPAFVISNETTTFITEATTELV